MLINSAFQGFRAKVPFAVILTWGWVLLTTTIAVYVFGESPLVGTLTFLSALAVFPPLYALLELRYKRPVPTPLRTAPAAILFTFGMAMLMSSDYRSTDIEPQPAGTHVLLDLVGIGDDDTDSFTSRPQNWRLEYVFQCWNFGRPGHFRIDIRKPDGSPSGLEGVLVHAKSDARYYVYTPGGSFRLHILSNCRWRVKASG